MMLEYMAWSESAGGAGGNSLGFSVAIKDEQFNRPFADFLYGMKLAMRYIAQDPEAYSTEQPRCTRLSTASMAPSGADHDFCAVAGQPVQNQAASVHSS